MNRDKVTWFWKMTNAPQTKFFLLVSRGCCCLSSHNDILQVAQRIVSTAAFIRSRSPSLVFLVIVLILITMFPRWHFAFHGSMQYEYKRMYIVFLPLLFKFMIWSATQLTKTIFQHTLLDNLLKVCKSWPIIMTNDSRKLE